MLLGASPNAEQHQAILGPRLKTNEKSRRSFQDDFTG
jgi:hypothetical protein